MPLKGSKQQRKLPGYLLAPSCQLEASLTWKEARRRSHPGMLTEHIDLSRMLADHLIETAQIRFHHRHTIFEAALSAFVEDDSYKNAQGGNSDNQQKLKISHFLFPFLRLAAASPHFRMEVIHAIKGN